MNKNVRLTSNSKALPAKGNNPGKQHLSQAPVLFNDNRPESIVQRKFGEIANNKTIQKQHNNTGLPDTLKTGVESLSGYSLDDVKVHYNSSRPAQLQALAYAQGTEIHLGPGQEKHLPHEAWHVVQQKQGRVRPTIQMKAGVNVNDDEGLEREADIMGGKALQMKSDGMRGLTSKKNEDMGSNIIQLTKLKIGISGDPNPLNLNVEGIPDFTYVWILSNKKGAADEFAPPVVHVGQNKSSPKQIIDANLDNINTPLYYKMGGYKQGYHMKGIFQSGLFIIPRGGDQSGIDYSFLRFAALEAYKLWFAGKGRWDGWPDISADGTMVETIDSDTSGITTDTGVAKSENKLAEGNWLAEAGVYKWSWQELKSEARINEKFTSEGIVDTSARDTRLKEFADVYFHAEVVKRDEAAASILQIYFPEPATRLSSYAIDLLSNSGFQNMKLTRGNQLGFGRESIGLIAGLVHLDKKRTGKDESRSISKLKYNSAYIVPTDLGKRKGAFISLFLNWLEKTKSDVSVTDINVFNGLSGVEGFDQSYLNSGLPAQVSGWHRSTLDEMDKPGKDAESFFHPKA